MVFIISPHTEFARKRVYKSIQKGRILSSESNTFVISALSRKMAILSEKSHFWGRLDGQQKGRWVVEQNAHPTPSQKRAVAPLEALFGGGVVFSTHHGAETL